MKLPLKEFESLHAQGALILDFRPWEEFSSSFIPDALYAKGFTDHDMLMEFAAADREIVLIAQEEQLENILEEMLELGFNRVKGYLQGGFDTWQSADKPIDMIISVEAEEVMLEIKFGNPHVVDIRSAAEYGHMHLEGADHVSARKLISRIGDLPNDETYYLYDEDGELSGSVISNLKRFKLHNFYHIAGGFKALSQAEAPMVTPPKKP